jgi:hypothetical protein
MPAVVEVPVETMVLPEEPEALEVVVLAEPSETVLALAVLTVLTVLVVVVVVEAIRLQSGVMPEVQVDLGLSYFLGERG